MRVPFFAEPDDEIEVSHDFDSVTVQIGPIILALPTYEFACQVEVAFSQARALLEPVNEPDAADVAVADVDRSAA